MHHDEPKNTTEPLLILDLDEALIFATETPLAGPADFRAGPYFVYKRPFVDAFLATMRPLFRLAVWTSSGSDYAAAIVDALFGSPPDLEFLWTRERCTPRIDEFSGEPVWIKDLKKVKRRGHPLDQVLMVDDSPEKLARNHGNLIRVTPFEGDPADDELSDLAVYLKRIHAEDDFRSIEKRNWRSRLRDQAP